jgi:predicted protein tyrosine phosphatase
LSIGEPFVSDSFVSNKYLEGCPHLRLAFWDTCEPVEGLFGEIFDPPTKEQAAQIVDFLEKNRGKNILVNCAAGISRSGAVCAFLEKHMNYEWLIAGRKRTYKKHGPNLKLLGLMEHYYLTLP